MGRVNPWSRTGCRFGVYVHVPFCRFRCDYCAFATYTDRDHLMEDYAVGCVTEIGRARIDEGLPPATSVFFGGGTPSRLPADLLVGDPRRRAPRADGAEVTVECNPEDVTPDRLATYRLGGVTRISLGRAVDGPPRARRPGPAPRCRPGGRGRRRGGRGRVRHLEHGPDHRRGRRERRRLGAEPGRRGRPGPPPRPTSAPTR